MSPLAEMCAEAEAPSALRAEGAGQWVVDAARAAPVGSPVPTQGDWSGGRSGKVMCPHLCAICFHDTGRFSAPPLIRLSSGSQPLGSLSPSPTPCVSAGFYAALEGSVASRGRGAVGSGGTLPVPEGGKQNTRRRGCHVVH